MCLLRANERPEAPVEFIEFEAMPVRIPFYRSRIRCVRFLTREILQVKSALSLLYEEMEGDEGGGGGGIRWTMSSRDAATVMDSLDNIETYIASSCLHEAPEHP